MDCQACEASSPVTTNPLSAACSVLHHAVCLEAVRVIFALHFLSHGGVDHLVENLQHCHRADDNALFDAAWTAEDKATAAAAPSSCLVERHSAPFLQQGDGESCDALQTHHSRVGEESTDGTHATAALAAAVSFPTPAAARSCVAHASPLSLYTAAHLLRCSAWTAASLTPTARDNDEDHESTSSSAPIAFSQLWPKQVHALELLRTREPGWCATALVRYTEWLLREDGRRSARAQLAAALSLTEYQRVHTPPPTAAAWAFNVGADRLCGAVMSSSRWLTAPTVEANSSASEEGPMLCAASCVVVRDALPFFFPWLRSLQHSGGTKTLGAGEVRNSCSLCCSHQWLLESLPRWCVEVTTERHARMWHHNKVRSVAMVRWRTRRGLRVMAHLSHVAEQRGERLDYAPADMGSSGQAEQRDDNDAANAVMKTPHRREMECQTTTQHTDSTADSSPSSLACVGEQRTSPADVVVASSSVRSETEQSTHALASPARSTPLPADVTTRSAVTAYEVSLLDRVLQSHASDAQPPAERSAVITFAAHEEERASRAESAHERKLDSSAKLATAAAQSPSRSATPRADAPLIAAAKSAQENENHRLDEVQQRHRLCCLRAVFLQWRNGRLYESMATRYLRDRNATQITRHSWSVWSRRHAVRERRRKEARDDALGEMVTEQKAVHYFRRLLRLWRRAALARRFLLRSIAARALHTWRCQAHLVQYRRATQQPFVGARRQLGEAWQRWCDRRREMVADRQRAGALVARTLAVMQVRCTERHALLTAATTYNKSRLALVWRTWRTRLTRDRPASSPAYSEQSGRRLRERALKQWRVRFLQRKQNRRHSDAATSLLVRATLQHCLLAWVRRCQLESRVRVYAARHNRLLLLKPAFEKWLLRAEVRGAVRRGQEELAWRVGEQLVCRKVLRVWLRRAAVHAAGRRAAAAAEMKCKAVKLARLNGLARAFYRWRTRQVVLRRYDVDRRRTLPEMRRALPLHLHPAASIPPLATAGAPPPSVTTLVPVQTKSTPEELAPTDFMAMPVQPLPPRSAATSPAASRAASARSVSRASQRPASSAAAARPRSPRRQRATPGRATVSRSAAAQSRDRGAAETHREEASVVRTEVTAQPAALTATSPLASLAAASRSVVCCPSTAPPRRRALVLERQLFAAQQNTRLTDFAVCLPSKPAVQHTKPAVSQHNAFTNLALSGHLPAESSAGALRWSANAHSGAQRAHRGRSSPRDTSGRSGSESSDVDRQVPIRSHTATPLFTRGQPMSWSPDTALPRTSHLMSDLVESPPQHLRRAVKKGSNGVGSQGNDNGQLDASPPPLPSSRASSHRLLSQMEQLLRRVRGIEADYRSPLPTSSRVA